MNGSPQNIPEVNQNLLERIEKSLDGEVYWWSSYSDDCVDTEWRMLPFAVVLSVSSGRYCVDIDPGNTSSECSSYKISRDDVMLIPAGIKHRLSVERGTVAAGFHIHFSILHNLDILSFFSVPPRIPAAQSKPLRLAIDALTRSLSKIEMKSTFSLSGLATVAEKRSRIFQLCANIMNCSELLPEAGQQFKQMYRIGPALKIIDEQLGSALRIETLAEHCSLSRNGFSRLFRQITGVAPSKYINQKRMTLAMSLLVYSELPVSLVAEQVGFCDQFHFSKTFRKETGFSPSQYRSSVRSGLSS